MAEKHDATYHPNPGPDAPAEALPTLPGAYVDQDDHLFTLTPWGKWLTAFGDPAPADRLPLPLTPLVRASSLVVGDATPAELIAVEVLAERDRQDRKWGEQDHPDGTGSSTTPLSLIDEHLPTTSGFADLAEAWEFRTAAEAATSAAARDGKVSWRDILLEEVFEALAEVEASKLRAELVQVAAVAQAWVRAIDRRTGHGARA